MSDMPHNELYLELLSKVDTAFRLMTEYDSLPHQYGAATLYQAESKVIQYIGNHENTTITDIVKDLGKTPSAYSQIIRKLRQKGWVAQIRNEKNNREYNLCLTEAGREVFDGHEQFEQFCYARMFDKLKPFSHQDLQIFCDILEQLNLSFEQDVKDSRRIGDSANDLQFNMEK